MGKTITIHPATCDTCKHLPICKYRDFLFHDFCDCANRASKKYGVEINEINIYFHCDNYKKKF